MAIVINSNPPTYSGLHNDLLFTVYEGVKAIDPTTYPNYKYVCDVYVAGVLIFRAKAFPNPVNKRGLFNIAPILRNYIAQQFNPLANTSGILCQQFGSGEFYLDVVVKFGEEYSFTTYTNLLIDSSRRYYNHYNYQTYSSPTILNNYVDKLASNRPYNNSLLFTAPNYYVPFFSVGSSTINITVNSYAILYNATRILAVPSTSIINTASGQRILLPGSGYVTSARTGSKALTVTAGSLQELNFSVPAINQDIPGQIDATTDFYVVTINSTINLLFKIDDERIHKPFTLHFLNQIGGMDSRDFRKLNRKTYDIEKKQYLQTPFRMDGSGVLTYATSHGVVYESRTNYASMFKQKQRLSTELLNDLDWLWLKELVFSPLVYIQDGSTIVPVDLKANNYEEIRFVNERAMKPLLIDIEYGIPLNAQFR
jgi:hypothetical protein